MYAPLRQKSFLEFTRTHCIHGNLRVHTDLSCFQSIVVFRGLFDTSHMSLISTSILESYSLVLMARIELSGGFEPPTFSVQMRRSTN